MELAAVRSGQETSVAIFVLKKVKNGFGSFISTCAN